MDQLWNHLGKMCIRDRHDRFNPPQMMATNGNLVRGEDELKVLLVAATVEFRKDEMIVRQQQ